MTFSAFWSTKSTKKKPAQHDRIFFLVSFLAPLAALTLFFLYPLLQTVRRSFTDDSGALGFGNYIAVFKLRHIPDVLINSLLISGSTTIVCIVLGFAIAFMLQRTTLPGKWLVRTILILPLLAPSLVQALGIIFLFGRNGLVNNLLDVEIEIYGFWGLLISNCMYALPQAVMILETSLRRSDARTYDAALLLGASRWRCFVDITLPASKFALISASFVIFTVSITDFGNAAVIGGSFRVLAMEIYSQVVGQLNFNMGAVVGIMLLLPTLLAIYIQRVANQHQFGTSSESSVPVTKDFSPFRDIPLGIVVYAVAILVAAVVATVIFASFVRLWPYRLEFTLANYDISIAGGYRSLWTTLVLSLQTAVIGTGLLFLLALAQRRLGIFTARIVYLLAIIPVGVPGLVLGLSYVLAFNMPDTLIGTLYGTVFILAICNFYHYHSQGFLTMVTGIRSVPRSLEETTTCLGGSSLHALRDAIMPVMTPTLISVSFFLFMRAMVSLSAVIFLVTPATTVAAVTVMDLNLSGRRTAAAAFSVCIMATVLAAMLMMHAIFWISSRRNSGASITT